MKRTFVDSNVLIAAARKRPPDDEPALQLLADPTREFASSVYVQLEVLPKAKFTGRTAEIEFYEAFFANVTHWADDLPQIARVALAEGSRLGLAALDALHVAAAASLGAHELVTLEGSERPLYRTRLVEVVWLSRAVP